MRIVVVLKNGSRTYFITDRSVPSPSELPWHEEECDAYVAILEAQVLTDTLARDLAHRLVCLRVGWVEIIGPKSEFLHDLVDNASVLIGRQNRVGDGDPMTTWDHDTRGIDEMVDWMQIGHGATDNKLVVIVDSKDSASVVADKLRNAHIQ